MKCRHIGLPCLSNCCICAMSLLLPEGKHSLFAFPLLSLAHASDARLLYRRHNICHGGHLRVGSPRRRFRDGWRFCNTAIMCSLLIWVYRCVVAMEACP